MKEILLGITYGILEYIGFMFFTLLGMVLIKSIRYKIQKKKNPDLKFCWAHWWNDNSLDFAISFLMSFLTIRFIFELQNNIPQIPKFEDVMFIGFLVGLFFQYIFHKLMNKVKVN